MLPWIHRRSRRNGRARCRPNLTGVESLETRALLANTPLGHSLPDLIISGFAGPAASWGGPIQVTVNVQNIAAGSQPEPFNQQAGATSDSDAAASQVSVYASTIPRFTSHAVLVSEFNVPALTQNNLEQVSQTITLPNRPAGFPGDGGRVYLFFQANSNGAIQEYNTKNNFSGPSRVFIEAPLPELSAVALDVPPVMQPGDTINPTIRIANFGTAATNLQGPVTVDLVASVTPGFGPGSSILGTYTVANIPAASTSASQVQITGDTNLNPQSNIVTINGGIITLPTSPAKYYIGVVIDPQNKIKQLQSVGGFRAGHSPFSLAHVVGPPITNLPPAGVQPSGTVVTGNVFPFPASNASIGMAN
ncbi:MAG: hypothetical protein P4L84_08115 [Isosphaeraceae bacterium]|nr:hypothetical protein [Isosphaeraceae bacterium]